MTRKKCARPCTKALCVKGKKLINITDKHLVSLGIDKRLLIMTDRKQKIK